MFTLDGFVQGSHYLVFLFVKQIIGILVSLLHHVQLSLLFLLKLLNLNLEFVVQFGQLLFFFLKFSAKSFQISDLFLFEILPLVVLNRDIGLGGVAGGSRGLWWRF